MNTPRTLVCNAALCLAGVLACATAGAHSASDAYLTFIEQPRTAQSGSVTVLHVQWDIALRDLDFVLKLDDNGDGKIVWGELRKHQEAIAKYAYQYLLAQGDGRDCRLSPTRQLVDDHADGAYASLLFDISCAALPKRLKVDYRLFFDIDPSHRAIVVLRNGDNIATALMTSEKTRIELDL